jgi:DNA repair exonuclease SbcCD nuclease subunit
VSRIFVSSDWHADACTYGVARYGDVRQAALQVVDACEKERGDLFLFLGDLCDPDDCPAALQAVELAVGIATRLAFRKIPSWWIAGNHDVIEDGTGRTTLSVLRALCLPEVEVFEKPDVRIVPGGDVPLLALPFTAASHRYDPRAAVAENVELLGELAVVAGHLTLEGILPGEETTDMPRGRMVDFPIAECPSGWLKLNGHYHERQVFRGVQIPGSLAKLSFGATEATRPSYLVLEV